MERAAGLAHDDTPQKKLDKLDAVLAQTSTSTEDAALFAEMLSLPNDGRYPTLDLTSEQRRQRTLSALISQMEALTRTGSGADDLRGCALDRPHEPRSCLVASSTGFANLRVLLIVTFRPEFEPPWIGRPYVTVLTLNRLARARHRCHDRRRRRQQAHSGEHPARHHRAHRRHSPVRGGNDQGGTGSGKRGSSTADCRCHSVTDSGGPGKLAGVADGAARPARGLPRRWRRSELLLVESSRTLSFLLL